MLDNGRRPQVFVGLPARPGECMSAGLLEATHNTGAADCVFCFQFRALSLLTTNFNLLWCDALNLRASGVTHFAMVHADVVPEPGWLGVLLREYQRVGCDVLSCCIPLKDERGLTSTGIMHWRSQHMRKLTVAETLKLPVTFTVTDAVDAGYGRLGLLTEPKPDYDYCLLMNTGLWVCDLTKPWAEKVVFRQHDSIVRQRDGQFRPVSVSEDWLFSVDCARLGLKCHATTAVRLKHVGSFDYPNYVAFGTGVNEADDDACVAWNIDAPASWEQAPDSTTVPTAASSTNLEVR